MEFITLALAPAVAPFVGALAVVLVLFVVEVVLTLIAGSGCTSLMESLVSMDSLPDTSFTNWLLVREVPLLMTILSFLMGFGSSGLLLQVVAAHTLGSPLPFLLMLVPTTAFGAATVRMLALSFKKMRVVHTTALTPQEFIGQVATLTSPEARQGYSGEASFTDRHGYTHYLMVEPDSAQVVFTQGDKVVLDSKVSDALYRAHKVG